MSFRGTASGGLAMEMFQVRYVLAAAKMLNFTKAATDCNVSQPALTKAVKTLEDELGAPLFHREGKRVLLSEFGRSILPHLQQIMQEAHATRTLADNFRLLNQVPIRLGVMSTIGHVKLARFLAKFQRDYHGVELEVSEASVQELKNRLEQGDLDLAVLNPLEGLGAAFRVHDLYSERYVVVFAPDHRLASLNAIKLVDLSQEPYVDRLSCEMRDLVMGVCRERNVCLYARFRSEREDWIQSMVLARIGFAFMPEYSVTSPELLQRPLIEPAVARTVSLASVPGRPYSPATAALVRAAQSFDWPG
ncbi:MAG: LysR family transcriptional regulator [Mesorhizobium sp.]|nr:MAG: LysR family transcriptional regulator [Mesorhizobium sp.]RWH47685.1 MAG: LysR family transcriptional regulator [Mesorhizobium sp.]RWH52509.1 MAG: LysR family transcriptional regulator [Mesorhizobium sp.]RWI64374.1 MAG: LysR family transcriptional regulator [Mesorhizobium sp.]RWI68655.1 MAG: LysR family transcriptional regulator [Mesorhizobium sp.]